MHTCPATCLHHKARAGRDSVCQCLQWSDYAPVLRHVQSFSVCSLSSALLFTSACLRRAAEKIPAHVWAPQRHNHLSVQPCKQLRAQRHLSQFLISICRWRCCSHTVLQLWKEGKGKRREKKNLRSADSVLHAIPKGPSKRGEREKGEKGVGD